MTEDAAGPDQHLAEQFEAHRAHLLGVAHRVLGAGGEAAGRRPGGVAAAAADRLGRRRQPRRLADHGRRPGLPGHAPEPGGAPRGAAGPQAPRRRRWARAGARRPLLAESVGRALLVVLDTLTPPERLAFVLHDLFAVPFDEVAAGARPQPGGGPPAGQPRPAAGAEAARARPTRRTPGGARARCAPSWPPRADGDFGGLLRRPGPRRRAAGGRRRPGAGRGRPAARPRGGRPRVPRRETQAGAGGGRRRRARCRVHPRRRRPRGAGVRGPGRADHRRSRWCPTRGSSRRSTSPCSSADASRRPPSGLPGRARVSGSCRTAARRRGRRP